MPTDVAAVGSVVAPTVVVVGAVSWALCETSRSQEARERAESAELRAVSAEDRERTAREEMAAANARVQEAERARDQGLHETAAANERAREAERARDQGYLLIQEMVEREERARHDAAAANRRAQQSEQALEQERQRAHEAKLQKWRELNREYPIPAYLCPYVTGVNDSPQEPASEERFVNVAVLGNSGVGKSCLIKAMLEYFHSEEAGHEPAACLQGNGTAAPTPYALKTLGEKVHIWDLPGQGTKEIPKKTYLRDMGLKYFDAVLVATSGRWLENDERLLDAVKCAELRVSVVRTKMDQAVQDGKADNDLSQEEVLQQAREKLEQDLGHYGPNSTKIHLVTVRKQYWVGEDGSAGFGTITELCDEVAERIRSQRAG